MQSTVVFVTVCLAFTSAFPYQHVGVSFEELTFDPKVSKDFHEYEAFYDEHRDWSYDSTEAFTTGGYETATHEDPTMHDVLFETTSETMTTDLDEETTVNDVTTGKDFATTGKDFATTGTVYDTTGYYENEDYTTDQTYTENDDEMKLKTS